jgi:hypothetical protein
MELVKKYYRLVVVIGCLLAAAALLGSCAGGQDVATALSQPLDSTIQNQVARQLHTGRVKIKGHVTIQYGTGNVNAPKAQGPVAAGGPAQDFTKAGQHGGALATEPGASAGATTRTGIPPWALVIGGLVVLLLLLLGLAYRFRSKLKIGV